MLEELYYLGTLAGSEARDVETPNPLNIHRGYTGTHLRLLHFDQDPHTGTWRFVRVSAAEIDPDTTLDRVLFRPPKANATADFPAIDVYKKDLWVEGAVNFAKSKVGGKFHRVLAKFPALAGIAELLNHDPDLHDQLAEACRDLDRFLLAFHLNGQDLARSEFMQEAIARLRADPFAEYHSHKGKRHVGRDQVCALRGARAAEVWGYASVFNCYSAKTEFGSISGGFDLSQAWKNFPVSKAALETMLAGKSLLRKHFHFRMCGYDYFLLPRFLGLRERETAEEMVALLQDFGRRSVGAVGRANGDLATDLLALLAEERAGACYTLVFFREDKAKFEIMASVDDIFPHYNRRLLEAIDRVARRPSYRDLPGKDKTLQDLRFSFRIVKDIFPENKREGKHRSGFLNTVRALLMEEPLDERFLLTYIVALLRRRHFANQGLLWPATRCLALLELSLELGLLANRQTYHRKDVTMDSRYQAFFDTHGSFFDGSAARKAVFLQGTYCQKLLDIQNWRLKNRPFFTRLNGLKLDPRRLRMLWPEMKAKLTFYGYDRAYQPLEHAVAEMVLAAGDELNRMKPEECAYLFTLGMALHLRVHPKPEKADDTETSTENANEPQGAKA
ncbi:CRISPR-associated protein TM1802 (cas_TM1802) [Sulfidibacter corallicola]|uniref:CRISPR-associated protein Csh1 n=1 Tax=Sulfidibacter corallicola TaxID=2818388 RepID=A0A8A4TLT6_SULCO|nr:TM1802 family CRISPR-associated protein [Sulfidibacter corallicola]QTD50949.1 hypothetical protein J3U87_00640 [Sulfidibacter corallicola]